MKQKNCRNLRFIGAVKDMSEDVVSFAIRNIVKPLLNIFIHVSSFLFPPPFNQIPTLLTAKDIIYIWAGKRKQEKRIEEEKEWENKRKEQGKKRST